jgi:CHASE2 domain-containing sensor protein
VPPRVFAILILSVIAAAGATIALWAWAGLPLVALGFAALCASLILGWRGLRR